MTKPKHPSLLLLAAAVLGATLAPSASAQTRSGASPDAWSWRVAINLWLPGVDATTRFQLPDGGTIGSSLDTDYLGRPFEPMPALMAIAEYVTKTHAICMVCGNPASHTQRLVASDERLLLGATGTYEARCRRCFDPNLASSG